MENVMKLIDSLVWPGTVIALVYILRKPLNALLVTLTSLKYKDLQLDFSKELKEVGEEAKAIKIEPRVRRIEGKRKEPLQTLDEAERLLEQFPEPAVALAWSAIEDELVSVTNRSAISPDYPPFNSATRNAQLLLDAGYIQDDVYSLLKRMRNLGNIAVHGRGGFGPVSSDEAREFIALARGVVEKLEQITRN